MSLIVWVLACGGGDEGSTTDAVDTDPGVTETPGGGTLPDGVVCAPENVDEWIWGTPIREPLASMAFAGIAGQVYVLGGRTETAVSDFALRGEFVEGALDWSPTTSLPSPVEEPASVVVEGRLYVIGGDDGTENWDTIWSAVSDELGELSVWREETPLPVPTRSASVISAVGRLYVAGGYAGGGLGDLTDAVWSTPVGADGVVGPWREESALTEPSSGVALGLGAAGLVAVGGLLGTAITNLAFEAEVGADGVLGKWKEAGLYSDSVASVGLQFGDDLILLGGIAANGQSSNRGSSADLSGGWPLALLAIQPLPAPRSAHAFMFAGDSLVVAGGLNQVGVPFNDVRVGLFCK